MTASVERVTWRGLQERAEADLGASHEARWIVETVSGYDTAELAGAVDEPAPERAVLRFDEMLERRRAGEPLQYVLGRWGFRGLDLFVDARVLIPRPETEVVAEVALAEAEHLGARRAPAGRSGLPTTFTAVDLGTGSGALALALAVELPDASVIATDLSAGALAVARANLAGVGGAGTRVLLREGVWFGALPGEIRGRIDLIVSNPPYVADAELDALPTEVREFEPRRALVAGPTGLECIEQLITAAPGWLTTPGTFVCELAPHQAPAAASLAVAAGFAEVNVHHDLAGRERVLVARQR